MHPHTAMPASCRNQAGAATLFTSVVILFLTTVLVIAVSRTTIMEQRISANEIRARQAFEAAEAGLNAALHYMSGLGGTDQNNDNVADTFAVVSLTGTASAYSVAYCDPTNPPTGDGICPQTPGPVVCDALNNETNPPIAPSTLGLSESSYLNTPLIVACGWSDDRIGRAMVRQNVGTAPGMAKVPSNPLTAKGAMNVQGSATVTNYYNNLTIWTGGSLSNIGNSGKTFVRNPNVSPPDSNTVPPGPPSSCTTSTNYVCLTDKNTTGPDIIADDPTLSNLTSDQMFQNFFGTDFNTYRTSYAAQDITAAQASSLDGVQGQSIVINGNTTLPNGTIGSRERPVVLVINGNWEGGNPTVHGIVYVRGNVNVAGNPAVYGAAAVEGTVSGTGSLDVIYDPLASSNAAEKTGRPGLIPGSWRDWK